MKRTGLPKLDDLIEHLLNRGWQFTAGGRHNKFIAPCGKTVTVSKTASDRRALENIFHDLRRVARAAGENV